MSERAKGATSVSLLFRLTDSTTGAAKSGVDVTTLKLQYERPGQAAGTATSLTLLAALTTAWTSYGAKEVDATNSKGVYRVDGPDLAFATGADEVTLTVTGAGIEPSTRLIDLMGADMRNATNLGVLALPAAAANAAGGLPISLAGGLDLDEMNVDIEAIQTSTAGLTFTGAGKVDASVRDWVGDTIPARNVTGVPIVDAKYLLGTVFATPATAGILDVNAKNINNIATTSVTVVSANLGTTQPVNFTGTGASALAKSDMVDIAGAAVSATTAQLGVNVVNWNNTVVATPATAGIPDINVKNIVNVAAALDANNLLKVDVEDWHAVAVTTIVPNTASVIVTTNNDKTGYDLVNAPNATALTAIANSLLDQAAGTETNRTVRQTLRLMLAALVGKLSGAATSSVSIRDTNDTKNRVVATVDANGNRSAVTLDGT